MADSANLQVRPASNEEAGLYFAMKPEENAAMGCIGHVRMDFGRSGREFWHTWHSRGPEEWNSQVFKNELTTVVDTLRESVLKDLNGMREYCQCHGGDIPGGWSQNYGFVVETENYRTVCGAIPSPEIIRHTLFALISRYRR